MLSRGWGPELAVGGDSNKNQWMLIDSGASNENHKEMMLSSDMCLAYSNNAVHAACMEKYKDLKASERNKQCKDFQRLG